MTALIMQVVEGHRDAEGQAVDEVSQDVVGGAVGGEGEGDNDRQYIISCSWVPPTPSPNTLSEARYHRCRYYADSFESNQMIHERMVEGW